jgi:hypothetical protein
MDAAQTRTQTHLYGNVGANTTHPGNIAGLNNTIGRISDMCCTHPRHARRHIHTAAWSQTRQILETFSDSNTPLAASRTRPGHIPDTHLDTSKTATRAHDGHILETSLNKLTSVAAPRTHHGRSPDTHADTSIWQRGRKHDTSWKHRRTQQHHWPHLGHVLYTSQTRTQTHPYGSMVTNSTDPGNLLRQQHTTGRISDTSWTHPRHAPRHIQDGDTGT